MHNSENRNASPAYFKSTSRFAESLLWLNDWGSISRKGRRFSLVTASRLALGYTCCPNQWVPEFFSCGQSQWGMKLTTHVCIVLRSIMSVLVPPLAHMSSWYGA
jgi:hypothetical protein